MNFLRRHALRFLLLPICALLFFQHEGRAEGAPATSEIYQRFTKRIAQVRVIDSKSQSKSTIGSGFFVGDGTHLVTNYHVISQLLLFPGEFSVDVILSDGKIVPAKLTGFDIIHDLAVLKPEHVSDQSFSMELPKLTNGDRVYAFGNPKDLGMTVVEGTYNGLIAESFYQKIHFTGSLNPGMSGGPAILADGSLVGVNVSSEGDQLSFLVPAQYVVELVKSSIEHPSERPDMHQAEAQLVLDQDTRIKDLLVAKSEKLTLDKYSLPGKLSPAFRCWGDTIEERDDRLHVFSQFCGTEDALFISHSLYAGRVTSAFATLSSKDLSRFQLYRAAQENLIHLQGLYPAPEHEVTSFVCRNEFVNQSGIPMRALFCARRYKKLQSLHDVVVQIASLNSSDTVLVGSLSLAGVTMKNAEALARRFIEGISWSG